MKKNLKKIPFYTLLFSLYPVLALLATNVDQITLPTALRAMLVSFFGALVLLFIAQAFLRNWARSALVVFWILLLFFSYGHVYDFLKQNPVGATIGHHTLLLPLWLVFWVAGIILILRKVQKPKAVIPALNLITLLLLAIPFTQIILFNVRITNLMNAARRATTPMDGYRLPADGQSPDIYYIILDAYTREDDLSQYYQFDNTPFIADLESMGFYVARCSQSNYAQTELSLSSSLNFNYLDALNNNFTADNADRSALWPLIQHSAVQQIFKSLGYTIVNFKNNYSWLALNDADYFFISPDDIETNAVLNKGGMNSFEIMFLRSTAGIAALDIAQKLKLPKKLQLDVRSPEKTSYRRVLYTLDKLKYHDVPAMPGPKFLYIHIVSPHPPFVFNADGSFNYRSEEDNLGYSNQVAYLNQRMETIVKGILDHADTPPVIIIQGDHGINGKDPQRRMKIFNAYYLPGEGKQWLYPSISPVNTFRVVLNSYFGGNLELLPDTSYYSTYQYPYKYQIIPDQNPDCGGQ
jgi:hypothetical protein